MISKNIPVALICLFVLSTLVFHSCHEENFSPNCTITSPSEGEEIMQSETVTITVDASDSDGTIAEVKFSVDGESIGSVNSSPYTYDWNTSGALIGDHTIKVTSVDDSEAASSDRVTIWIYKGNPAAFTASPTMGEVPLTVSFTDQSTNNPTSWYWDFGDGESSTEQSPTHTYNSMDQYEVSLVTTSSNGSDTVTKKKCIIAKGILTDTRDNQPYSIVKIGSLTWFAENVNYETADSWWYKNSEENGNIYGRLYTWESAKNACPGGWHLPTDEEWKTLEMYVGMSAVVTEEFTMRGEDEGKRLKSLSLWSTEFMGTDEVGFSALPAGYREKGGTFNYINTYTGWWTNDDFVEAGISRFMDNTDQMGRYRYNKETGFSVRCVKN